MTEVPTDAILTEIIKECSSLSSTETNMADHTVGLTEDVKKDLSDEQIQELKEAFSLFDKDGDGAISSAELGTVMCSLGQNPSEEELDALVQEMDADGDGLIDFEEFIIMMAHQMRDGDSERKIGEAFRVFDPDRTGYLLASELRHIMTNLGDQMTEDEVDDMMKELNLNADGKISCEEFLAVLRLK